MKIRSFLLSYVFLSTRKYSCSAPTVATTLFAVVLPKSLKILNACFDTASIDFKRGVFLSSASPEYEKNAVGMYNVLSLINAYDVGSHAVYPLASNVARRPPEGNDEASGSPLISSLPENSIITVPSPTGEIKLSCFSAVIPVIGWNQ